MTIRQTASKLKLLGFEFFKSGTVIWGKTKAEPFTFDNHLLSDPYRDVFIGECKGGWYISSHINFRARRRRETTEYQATILNIFGGGATLEEALTEFDTNFRAKRYNKTVYS